MRSGMADRDDAVNRRFPARRQSVHRRLNDRCGPSICETAGALLHPVTESRCRKHSDTLPGSHFPSSCDDDGACILSTLISPFALFYSRSTGRTYHRRKLNPFLHTSHMRIILRRHIFMTPDHNSIERALLLERLYRLLFFLLFILSGGRRG